MFGDFFKLIPERVQFEQFWFEIRKRNKWLIYLRYGAFLLLTSLIIGILILESIYENFHVSTFPLWIIAFSILIYNLIFHGIWNYLAKKRSWINAKHVDIHRKGFRSMHFSMIQILTDFMALMLFIYFTGGVETPLYVMFIFHVIIGSLFLPGPIMFLIITITLATTIVGSILELSGSIPHHSIAGLLDQQLYTNEAYLIVFFTIFGIALYLSIYLANSIAMRLYSRERALTDAYKQLEDAEKTKSKYVMSVVHDLKTPVSAVLTYLNMILGGNLGEIKDVFVKPLERSQARLKGAINIINDILYISQLKLESEPKDITDIDLHELIEEIYSEFSVIANSKNIDYSFEPFQQGIIIKGDRRQLKLAISNLVSNAVKYVRENGKIEVTTESNNKNIVISIADTGIGIPPQEKDKIFNDFYRSTISKKSGIEGTGLGMSIVTEVIRHLNGKIEIDSPSRLKISDELPGSEFRLIIPKV